MDVLNDEGGLIGLEISVGECEFFCRGWDFGFEVEDGDGIVLWNGSRGEPDPFLACANFKARGL